MKPILIILILAAGVLSCGKSIDTPATITPTPTGKLRTFVLPATTDAAITTYPDSHYVYLNRDAAKLNKLLVFLPGGRTR